MHIPQEAHCSCSRVDTSCAVTGYIVRRGALICTASGVQMALMLWLPIELINDTTSHEQDDIRKGSHNRDDEMQNPWPNSNL